MNTTTNTIYPENGGVFVQDLIEQLNGTLAKLKKASEQKAPDLVPSITPFYLTVEDFPEWDELRIAEEKMNSKIYAFHDAILRKMDTMKPVRDEKSWQIVFKGHRQALKSIVSSLSEMLHALRYESQAITDALTMAASERLPEDKEACHE